MPVTDTVRLQLLSALQQASPEQQRVLETELKHQRDLDNTFVVTERFTLAFAGLLALIVVGVAVWFGSRGLEQAAAIAVIADVVGVVTLLIRRSYFIQKVE